MPTETDIQSRITFLETAGGKRVPFRSLLEARWAVFFTQCGLKWQYEPKRFQLPSGIPYTPDFRVHKVGWFEIKPTPAKLLETEAKIREFINNAALVLSNESEKMFFVSVGGRPNIAGVMYGTSPRGLPITRRALAELFYEASTFRRGDVSLRDYSEGVIRLAAKTAASFRQGAVSFKECLFKFRHDECGTAFTRLSKDYKGEEDHPFAMRELLKVYVKQQQKYSKKNSR